MPHDSHGGAIISGYSRERVTEVGNWQGLDLTTAIRILEHAGRSDPTRLDLEPQAQIQALIDALCDLSMHDGLTGLVNPTFFRAALASEIDRGSRTGHTCGVMMLDLDRFKLVNDTYGHHVGDYVLKAVAIRLKKSLRSMDLAARIGGEEFAVMLPECTPEDAVRAAIRIHGHLNPLVVTAGELTLNVTTSAGLVWTEPSIDVSPKIILAQADAELYRAKRSGRQYLAYPELIQTRVSAAEQASIVLPRFEEESYEQ
ncbi:MAG: GGDEF domain-containing protein [Acidobacteriia bacterium]|nr:GGDEF domain-containing protein [Terriglobia bacterium]